MNNNMLNIIEGDPATVKRNTNRLSNMQANVVRVRSEFIGKPEICHAIVENIIHLRRDPENAQHRALFWERLCKYEAILIKEMDIRWLLSICDTIVDVGNHVQSAIAMNIVQCINRCNLDSTLLANVVDGRLDAAKLNQELKMQTWGGMITADIPTGDMIYNMQRRLDTVVSRDPQLNRIWRRIKYISRESPAVAMNHLCRASRIERQRHFFL